MKLNIAELKTDSIEKKAEIDLDEEKDYMEIELEDMTEEEMALYREHKRKRNKRAYERMGYEYEL